MALLTTRLVSLLRSAGTHCFLPRFLSVSREMSESQDFSGKVAIVTGASRGIGAQTALELSRRGARVVLVARDEEKLKKVAASCPGQCESVVADLAQDEQVAKVVAQALAAFGRIDVLVNNAGFGYAQSFLSDGAIELFDRIMSVNLRAVVNLTHLAAPHLIKTKGNVVNVSSVAAVKPSASWAYCTAKAGLDHFSRCIAAELAPKGVRVNVVNPGPVKTDFVANMGIANVEEFYDRVKGITALQRVSEPEEITDIILFLASDKARGVTGSSWLSDNGIMVK